MIYRARAFVNRLHRFSRLSGPTVQCMDGTKCHIVRAVKLRNIMYPFFKTSKQSFLIPPSYDTLGSSFTPLESELFVA